MLYSQPKLALCDGFDARLREAFTYFPETGELRWEIGCYVGRRAGNISSTNRRRVVFEGTLYYTDELIYRYVRRKWPECTIEHLNGDRFDDRWANLSCAPPKL